MTDVNEVERLSESAMRECTELAKRLVAVVLSSDVSNSQVVLKGLASATGVVIGMIATKVEGIEYVLDAMRQETVANARANFAMVNNLPIPSAQEAGFDEAVVLSAIRLGDEPSGSTH